MTLNINDMRAVELELRITGNDREAGFTKPNGN